MPLKLNGITKSHSLPATTHEPLT